jgi:hypothetical protein
MTTKRELRETNTVRLSNGLPPLAPKKRDCLKCGVKIESDGCHHRLCTSCTKENQAIEAAFITGG